MYVKRECLSETGLFREDLFAQGYGEENDFCIRARHLGWRHVAAPGIFVGHVGGQSFGSAKHYLIERNLGALNRLHPGYAELIRDFQELILWQRPVAGWTWSVGRRSVQPKGRYYWLRIARVEA